MIGLAFIIHLAAIVLKAIADNEIFDMQNHVVAGNLGEDVVCDGNVRGFVFHNEKRFQETIVNNGIATFGRPVQLD